MQVADLFFYKLLSLNQPRHMNAQTFQIFAQPINALINQKMNLFRASAQLNHLSIIEQLRTARLHSSIGGLNCTQNVRNLLFKQYFHRFNKIYNGVHRHELLFRLDLLCAVHSSFVRYIWKKDNIFGNHGTANSSHGSNEFLSQSLINYRNDVYIWYGLCWYQVYLLLVLNGPIARAIIDYSWYTSQFLGRHSSSPLHCLLLVDF